MPMADDLPAIQRAHAHANEAALLVMLLALVQPFVMLEPRWKRRWAVVAVIGAAGLPLCILLELQWGLIAGGMADFCGLLLILALFASLFGVLRYTGEVDSQRGVEA